MSDKVNLHDTIDAEIWVQEWKKVIKENPSIPKCSGTMLAWFANAIMAGYDHACQKYQVDKLSASEALYGFGGWLTTRSQPVTISAKHEAAIVADLVNQFCEANNLPDPRDGWSESLVHPEERE
jgi:hypothetical protein